MKGKEYAVLCADCAERLQKFWKMVEVPGSGNEVHICCTCFSLGYFSKYQLTDRIPKKIKNA